MKLFSFYDSNCIIRLKLNQFAKYSSGMCMSEKLGNAQIRPLKADATFAHICFCFFL